MHPETDGMAFADISGVSGHQEVSQLQCLCLLHGLVHEPVHDDDQFERAVRDVRNGLVQPDQVFLNGCRLTVRGNHQGQFRHLRNCVQVCVRLFHHRTNELG